MINLGRSRLFQRLIAAIYWIAIPLLLLGALGAVLAEQIVWRGPLIVGFLGGAAVLGWRLWLYRRALGVAGAAPPLRRVLLVWAPLAALAFAGFAVVVSGFMVFTIPFWVMSEPKFSGATYGWRDWCVIAVFALIVIVFGLALTAPLVLMLRRRRPAGIRPEASPSDDDPSSQDASAT